MTVLTVTTVTVDDERPLLDLVPPVADALVWVRDGEGLVAWGAARTVVPGRGPARFDRADQQLQELAAAAEVRDEVELPGTGLVAIGSFTFDDDADGSVLVVPRVLYGRRGGVTWRTTIDPPDAEPAPEPAPATSAASTAVGRVGADRPRYAGSSLPDVLWLEAVATAVDRLGDGEADKVVLARDHAVWSHVPFDALAVASRLADRFPSCHTFVVAGLVGASPELLLWREGATIRSRALAGTAPRSNDEVADHELGEQLLASVKDRGEHGFAAASVREVLAPRCSDLTGDEVPSLLRLANVQHLATSFTGHLDDPEDPSHRALRIVGELHPTAAVGGTPRPAARAMIRELEGMDRGRYAAPVGWADASGDGEWAIALRCAELSGARARLFAGVGIVPGSLPEAELEETRLKLLAMQRALDPQTGPDVPRSPGGRR